MTGANESSLLRKVWHRDSDTDPQQIRRRPQLHDNHTRQEESISKQQLTKTSLRNKARLLSERQENQIAKESPDPTDSFPREFYQTLKKQMIPEPHQDSALKNNISQLFFAVINVCLIPKPEEYVKFKNLQINLSKWMQKPYRLLAN